VESKYFCELRAHEQFQNPRKTPPGRKVCDLEEKKRRKIIQKIVDTRAVHALRSDKIKDYKGLKDHL
jgi:hypothetical protein